MKRLLIFIVISIISVVSLKCTNGILSTRYLTRFWAYTINTTGTLFWKEWDPVSKSFLGAGNSKVFMNPSEVAADPRGRYLFTNMASIGFFYRVDTATGDATQVGSSFAMSLTSKAKYHHLRDIVYGFWGSNIIAAKFNVAGHTTSTYSIAGFCTAPNDLSLSIDGNYVYVACNTMAGSSLFALAIDSNGDINTSPVWQNSVGSTPTGSNSITVVTSTVSGNALIAYDSLTNKIHRLPLYSNGTVGNATVTTPGLFGTPLIGFGYNPNQTMIFGLTSAFQMNTIDTGLNLISAVPCGGGGTTGLILLPPFDRLLCSNNAASNNLITFIVESTGLLTTDTTQTVGALGLTKLFIISTPK